MRATDNFGTYRRMCGSGGGGCRDGLRLLCEILRVNEDEGNAKEQSACIGQESKPTPPRR